MPKLPTGRLTPVPLREAWENEATAFTPWLAKAENIKILAEELNLDLEVEAQERQVGPFRADILCRNTDDGSWVLIENQLERTDHSHLGQLLTYASGLDVVTIIWIAERFTEEHRATLDWLNEITDERFNFFGVELQLFKIDSSPSAPHFRVVSKPNNWSRRMSEAAKRIESDDLSPTRQTQLRLWTALRDYAENRGTFLRFQSPRPQNWTNIGIGRSKFWMSATVNSGANEASVQLAFQTAATKADFRQLSEMKSEIETEAGEQFHWREMPDKVQCRIEVRRSAALDDESSWPELLDWFVTKLELFHRVFSPRIRSLILAEPDGEE